MNLSQVYAVCIMFVYMLLCLIVCLFVCFYFLYWSCLVAIFRYESNSCTMIVNHCNKDGIKEEKNARIFYFFISKESVCFHHVAQCAAAVRVWYAKTLTHTAHTHAIRVDNGLFWFEMVDSWHDNTSFDVKLSLFLVLILLSFILLELTLVYLVLMNCWHVYMLYTMLRPKTKQQNCIFATLNISLFLAKIFHFQRLCSYLPLFPWQSLLKA